MQPQAVLRGRRRRLEVDLVEVAVQVRLAAQHDRRRVVLRVDVAERERAARREQPKALAQDLAPRRRRRLVEQEEDGDDVGLAAREPRRLGVVPFIGHVVAEVQRARVRQVPRRPQHLGRRVDADDGRLVPFSQRPRGRARARAQVHAIRHGRRADDGARRVDDVPGRVARVEAAVREGVEARREPV